MKRICLLGLLIIAFVLAPFGKNAEAADLPKLINYQGSLVEQGTDKQVTRALPITFEIYDAEQGGNKLWSEVQNVNVEKSLFNVYLGQSNPINLPFNSTYYLQVKVGNGKAYPRTILTASPYAQFATDADSAKFAFMAGDVKDGAITQAKLADGVTAIPMGDAAGDIEGTYPDNVTLKADAVIKNIKPGTITQGMLNSNVTTAPSGPAGGDLDGTYPDPVIAAGAIKTDRIADGAVTGEKLADGSVSLSKLDNASLAVTGDLQGSLPDPKVKGILGFNVIAPTVNNEIMTFDGISWKTTPLSNDMIANNSVELNKLNAGAAVGQVIWWNGTAWELSKNTAPENGQVLSWNQEFETMKWAEAGFALPYMYNGATEAKTMIDITKTDNVGGGIFVTVPQTATNAEAIKVSGGGANSATVSIDRTTDGPSTKGALDVNATLTTLEGKSYASKVNMTVNGADGYDATAMDVMANITGAAADKMYTGVSSKVTTNTNMGAVAGYFESKNDATTGLGVNLEKNATVVIKNTSAEADKVALITYGDVYWNSTAHGHNLDILDKITIGTGAEMITITAPAVGAPLTFDKDVKLGANGEVVGDLKVGGKLDLTGKLMGDDAEFKTLTVSDNAKVGTDITMTAATGMIVGKDIEATAGLKAVTADLTGALTGIGATFTTTVQAADLEATAGLKAVTADLTGALNGVGGTFTATVQAADLEATAGLKAVTADLTGALTGIGATFTATVKADKFEGNGSLLTDLDATKLNGIIPDANLGPNVAKYDDAAPTFAQKLMAANFETAGDVKAATGTFTGLVKAGTFEGDGAAITNINATNVATGTLADGRLTGNVALYDFATPTFTGALKANSLESDGDVKGVTGTFTGLVKAGTFEGNGAAITDINATNIATGTLDDARLTLNVAKYNDATPTFVNTVKAANFEATTDVKSVTGTFSGQVTAANARVGANIVLDGALGAVTASTFNGNLAGNVVGNLDGNVSGQLGVFGTSVAVGTDIKMTAADGKIMATTMTLTGDATVNNITVNTNATVTEVLAAKTITVGGVAADATMDLNVVGDANITGTLTVPTFTAVTGNFTTLNVTGAAGAPADLVVTGEATIGEMLTTKDLTVTNDATVTGTVTAAHLVGTTDIKSGAITLTAASGLINATAVTTTATVTAQDVIVNNDLTATETIRGKKLIATGAHDATLDLEVEDGKINYLTSMNITSSANLTTEGTVLIKDAATAPIDFTVEGVTLFKNDVTVEAGHTVTSNSPVAINGATGEAPIVYEFAVAGDAEITGNVTLGTVTTGAITASAAIATPTLNAGQILMGGSINMQNNIITNATTITASGLITGGSFAGDGAALTNLNATNVATGTLADARLTANVAKYTDAAPNFANGLTAASFTGVGTALTALTPANITAGVPDANKVLTVNGLGVAAWTAPAVVSLQNAYDGGQIINATTTLLINHTTNTDGLKITKDASSGNAFEVASAGSGNALRVANTAGGVGINLTNTGAGEAFTLTNSGTGRGLVVANSANQTAVVIGNAPGNNQTSLDVQGNNSTLPTVNVTANNNTTAIAINNTHTDGGALMITKGRVVLAHGVATTGIELAAAGEYSVINCTSADGVTAAQLPTLVADGQIIYVTFTQAQTNATLVTLVGNPIAAGDTYSFVRVAGAWKRVK